MDLYKLLRNAHSKIKCKEKNITVFDIKNKSKRDLTIVTGILEEECKKQIMNARKKES